MHHNRYPNGQVQGYVDPNQPQNQYPGQFQQGNNGGNPQQGSNGYPSAQAQQWIQLPIQHDPQIYGGTQPQQHGHPKGNPQIRPPHPPQGGCVQPNPNQQFPPQGPPQFTLQVLPTQGPPQFTNNSQQWSHLPIQLNPQQGSIYGGTQPQQHGHQMGSPQIRPPQPPHSPKGGWGPGRGGGGGINQNTPPRAQPNPNQQFPPQLPPQGLPQMTLQVPLTLFPPQGPPQCAPQFPPQGPPQFTNNSQQWRQLLIQHDPQQGSIYAGGTQPQQHGHPKGNPQIRPPQPPHPPQGGCGQGQGFQQHQPPLMSQGGLGNGPIGGGEGGFNQCTPPMSQPNLNQQFPPQFPLQGPPQLKPQNLPTLFPPQGPPQFAPQVPPTQCPPRGAPQFALQVPPSQFPPQGAPQIVLLVPSSQFPPQGLPPYPPHVPQ